MSSAQSTRRDESSCFRRHSLTACSRFWWRLYRQLLKCMSRTQGLCVVCVKCARSMQSERTVREAVNVFSKLVPGSVDCRDVFRPLRGNLDSQNQKQITNRYKCSFTFLLTQQIVQLQNSYNTVHQRGRTTLQPLSFYTDVFTSHRKSASLLWLGWRWTKLWNVSVQFQAFAQFDGWI